MLLHEIIAYWYWKYEYYVLLSFVAYSVVIGYFYAFSEHYLCVQADNWMRGSALLGGLNIVVSVIGIIVGPIVAVSLWGAVSGSLYFAGMLLVWRFVLGPWVAKKPFPVYLGLPLGLGSLCIMASHYFNPPFLLL